MEERISNNKNLQRFVFWTGKGKIIPHLLYEFLFIDWYRKILPG